MRVLKFGGSSLSKPEQIKSVAKKIAELHLSGEKLLIVVSAMGKTTDELTRLAYSVSPNPNRREIDMLLSTGERVSMALLSMALHDLKCPSISFTGSQAGVMTDGSHSSAKIIEIKPTRLNEALNKNQVVVLAGFQGVDPETKEITTLGRGGSDTTAVALAAHFNAKSCEILKDVDGVYTGDPLIVPEAKVHSRLSISALYEMCFWGAKVVHVRSVELSKRLLVPLFIGRSENFKIGTEIINEDKSMLETKSILSVNSHAHVDHLEITSKDLSQGLDAFHNNLKETGLPWPQVLASKWENGKTRIMYTADPHLLESIKVAFMKNSEASVLNNKTASVSLTCAGAISSDLAQKVASELKKNSILPEKMILGPMSLTFFIDAALREKTIQLLHGFITNETL